VLPEVVWMSQASAEVYEPGEREVCISIRDPAAPLPGLSPRFIAVLSLEFQDDPEPGWEERGRSITEAQADQVIDSYVNDHLHTEDANDILYAVEASHDYDPGPALERIEAPLLAINSADDLINPPELQILEREIKRVPHGRALVIPFSERTHGHGSHTYAVLWKQDLEALLKSPER